MISRRNALTTMALGSASVMVPGKLMAGKQPAGDTPDQGTFRYCLNTSTISGQNAGLMKYVEVASRAGYDGIEVWVRDVEALLKTQMSASQLRGFIEDHGIRVESAIGFAPWLAGDPSGFIQMEKEMEMLASIGCHRIAAPPAGLAGSVPLDLFEAGEKYAWLLELGRKTGVMPQLEFWGASPVLWHLGQVLMIVAAADDRDARILPDIYHLFRGGSGFETLGKLGGELIEIFHLNDYPGDKPRTEQVDADRVFPGTGVAPVKQVLTDLKNSGGEKVLSLELFNRTYWKEDPLKIARKGLDSMKSLVNSL